MSGSERWPTRGWRWVVWALDLECPTGEPDYAKMMQAATQFATLGLLYLEKPISAALCMILVVSAHGTRAVMAFIKSRAITGHAQDTRTHTITETREPNSRVDDERG